MTEQTRQDILDDIGAPAVTLVQGAWTLHGPTFQLCSSDKPPFKGEANEQTLAEQAESIWSQMLAEGKNIFGRPPVDEPNLLRLRDWSMFSEGDLTAEVQRTWFWSWVGSGRAAEVSIRQMDDWGLAEVERKDLRNIRDSQLANLLSTNLAIVSDDRLLVQRRGRSAGWRNEAWTCRGRVHGRELAGSDCGCSVFPLLLLRR